MERLSPRENLYVNWGDYVTGDITRNFISTGFRLCSGFVLRDKAAEKYGLFHAKPTQTLDIKDIETLKAFDSGKLILIEGTDTIYNPNILDILTSQIGMEVVKKISIDTNTTKRFQKPIRAFHINFNPMSDLIIVTRNFHNNQLVYNGFNDK